jgi:homogentisate phytyltransferase/homogentisate geranylgeranyltransferase
MTKSTQSESPSSATIPASPPLSLLQNPVLWLQAFWKFSRPHTIVGTSLSVVGLFAIAGATRYPLGTLPGTFEIWQAVTALLLTGLACLCGNVYIVGLNQLEDVEIDRVNKPHLPLASGEFLRSQALTLVILAGTSAIALAVLSQSLYLMATIWLSLAIGTAYSLPPIRLKRFPFWASFCILTVRGAVVNLGIFLHAASQLGTLPVVPARIWALTGFILVFSIAIAIFKDIPDIEGDRRYGINTFTVQLGQQAIFQVAHWLLTVCYLGMIGMAPFLPGVHSGFLIVSHSILLVYFWYLSQRVRLTPINPSETGTALTYPDFYQFIWKLFFAEYLLFPLSCWLSQVVLDL